MAEVAMEPGGLPQMKPFLWGRPWGHILQDGDGGGGPGCTLCGVAPLPTPPSPMPFYCPALGWIQEPFQRMIVFLLLAKLYLIQWVFFPLCTVDFPSVINFNIK